MKSRLAAITFGVVACVIAGTGSVAATPAADIGGPIILAQDDGEQLTPQNPGAPSVTTGESEHQAPQTGGVRWEDFGGDPANAPDDLDSFISTTLGWLKTIAAVAGILGLITIATLMVIGLRGRSEAARKAMDGVPAVLLATILAGSAWTIVNAIIT